MRIKRDHAAAHEPVTSIKGKHYVRAHEQMNKYRNQRYRIVKGEKLLRTGKHGDSCQQPPKSKEEDKLGKQGGSGRELSEKEDKLGLKGGCSQEQLKKKIKEESSLTGWEL